MLSRTPSGLFAERGYANKKVPAERKKTTFDLDVRCLSYPPFFIKNRASRIRLSLLGFPSGGPLFTPESANRCHHGLRTKTALAMRRRRFFSEGRPSYTGREIRSIIPIICAKPKNRTSIDDKRAV